MDHHPDCRTVHPSAEHCRDRDDDTLGCTTPGCDRPHRHDGYCSVEGAPLP